MPNVLKKEKQIAIVAGLAEGMGIRQLERMTGIFRDTIMNYGVRAGKVCTQIMSDKMQNLNCQEIQMDEIWGFVGKKQKNVTEEDFKEKGDVWTFCSLDPDSKAVPSFKCGKRDLLTTHAFIDDLATRMSNRIQLSSDGMISYAEAVERAFGSEIDYGQIVKSFAVTETSPQRRYSPTRLVRVTKYSVAGSPNPNLISTSYIERMNLTTRHHMRRLTRLTVAFSKKFENFEAAVGLHFFYYNFIRSHRSLRGATPAMALGVERSFLKVENIIEAMNG